MSITDSVVATEASVKSAFVDQAQGSMGLGLARQRAQQAAGSYQPTGGYSYTKGNEGQRSPTPATQSNIGNGAGAPIKIIYVKDVLD